ncbi:hypothetical protein, partial [Streptosporangium sp. NPDC000396]|uniref:hypothetical protein n=1 Tax=Streptosporangium sp. NPDC000396 TaxID=3366185 RepID=UPI0036B29609
MAPGAGEPDGQGEAEIIERGRLVLVPWRSPGPSLGGGPFGVSVLVDDLAVQGGGVLGEGHGQRRLREGG